MTWSMISNKNKLAKIGEYEEDNLLEEEELIDLDSNK
jgi:hypothetical protein